MSEIVIAPEGAVQRQPASMLEVIAQAASDPSVDVAKLQALLNMKFQIEERDAAKEYAAAMARLKSKLPRLVRHGTIKNGKGEDMSKFTLREDLDKALTPLMTEEGFSFSWDELEVNQYGRRFAGTMSHRDGHSEVRHITLALDESGFKNKTQASGSTAQYACRYLLKMLVNWVEEGEDNDGADSVTLNPDEVKDLEVRLTDTGSNTARFLEHMGGVVRMKLEKLEDLRRSDLKRAFAVIDETARLRAQRVAK